MLNEGLFAGEQSPSADRSQIAASLDEPDTLIELTSSDDFPFKPNLDDRSACSDSENKGISFQTCESTLLQPCPFSEVGQCETQSAIFANGKLSSISFKYSPEDFQMQQFIDVATKRFGPSKSERKGSPGAGIEMSMATQLWSSPELRVQVIEIAGVNFSGHLPTSTMQIFNERSGLPRPFWAMKLGWNGRVAAITMTIRLGPSLSFWS